MNILPSKHGGNYQCFKRRKDTMGNLNLVPTSFKWNIIVVSLLCSQGLESVNPHRQTCPGENNSHMGNLELSCSYTIVLLELGKFTFPLDDTML